MAHLSRTPRDRPALRPSVGALLASALLLAFQAHAQSLDSASSSCRSQPALCARVAGEETVVPQAAQRLAEFGASVTAVAVVLNEAHRKAIEQKLTECANMAREKVLRQHMQGRSPTPAEWLGPWPESGDTEQGHTLPAYLELARVLEPWLYHEHRNFDPDFPPEDLRRWERRFLD